MREVVTVRPGTRETAQSCGGVAFVALAALFSPCGCVERSALPASSGGDGMAGAPAAAATTRVGSARSGIRTSIGERFTLLPRDALGLRYFPDMAVLEIARALELALIVAALLIRWLTVQVCLGPLRSRGKPVRAFVRRVRGVVGG
jgi:hypothetical protein